MNKAEQILDKHLELRSWTKTVPKKGNLYNTLIDALNEALSISDMSHSICDEIFEQAAKIDVDNDSEF